MTDAVRRAVEHLQQRVLAAFLVLAPVVALEAVAGRREQPEVPPSPLAREGQQPLQRRLGDDDEVEAGGLEMPGRALELVDQRRAGRTGRLLARQPRQCALRRLRPRVGRIARKHHVVDDQRVAARSEQLGEADARGPAVGTEAVEDIVLLEPAARRQLPALARPRPPSAAAARSPSRADDRARRGSRRIYRGNGQVIERSLLQMPGCRRTNGRALPWFTEISRPRRCDCARMRRAVEAAGEAGLTGRHEDHHLRGGAGRRPDRPASGARGRRQPGHRHRPGRRR